ncbi:MAG: DUF481 domain-containing protein, partial [Steroidobacteraceae bacterium]
MQIRAWILCCATVVPVLALADEAPPPPPQNVWFGKGQLGFLASHGNSDAKSANAAIDLGLLEAPWEHKFHLGGLYGQSAGVTAAERWDALWQSNYDFTTDLFGFGALRYAHDDFSGFQHQDSAAVGIGYKIINTDTTKLSAQVGVGYRQLRPEELIKNSSGAVVERILQPSSSGAVLTAGVDYSQALSSTTTLSNKFLMESGSADTLFTDALALTVKMSTKLALSIGYALQDNT